MRLRQLMEAPGREPELAGLQAVGWYCSHTRGEIGLTPGDSELFNACFPERARIALVVRPSHFGPGRAAFFFRENDGSVRSGGSQGQFEVTPRRENRAVPVNGDGGAAPEAAAAVQPEAPGFQMIEEWRPGKWKWLAPAVLLSLAGAFGVERYYRWTAAPAPLSLSVTEAGGKMLIDWNRKSDAIRQARGGVLEILDGGERVEIQMDGERLREGGVDYRRRSEAIDVRLRIDGGRGAGQQEFIRFIGRLAASDDAAARPVNEGELKAEIEKLRNELERRDEIIRKLRAR
jgi:hypothetical protein